MDWQHPHIIKETLDWPEMHAWIINGKPNYGKLLKDFGDCIVSKTNDKMTFKDAVRLVREENYYLKDFHFYKINQSNGYKLPKVLQDDFLNEYFDHLGIDDYRFMYLGADGTFTPLHHDVLKSFSWSVNLTGFKKWTFISPEQECLLKDKLGNTLENIHDYDRHQFTEAAKIVVLELDQRPGEIMFVPSGWYHQVVNVGETLSINHNWINSHNLNCVFQYLENVFLEIKELIKEYSQMDDFQGHCQKILKANCGMNMDEFLDMIGNAMQKRVDRFHVFPKKEDYECLESFQQVLDSCVLSSIACNSLDKIQKLKDVVSKILKDINFPC